MRDSEARFRAMADGAPLLIWMAGTEGGCDYFNRPWLEFRGRTLAEESGLGWTEGIHPDDLQRVLADYRGSLALRVAFRSEFRLRRRDGAYRWMISSGSPRLGPLGEFAGYIGSCVDITEHRETEEQFRQAQKMEAVGRLAGGIAHDFNNLLTSINGYAELAIPLAEGNPELGEFLREIRRSGERAASLTNQLLAYSRKQILSPRILNLNEVVAEMDRMLRRLIGEDIRLSTELGNDLGPVRADPGQLQQTILNLALNARDAMPHGGRLTIETANVTLDEDYIGTRLEAKPGPYVMLAVSDTGTGMSQEVKARIFEPFFTTKAIGKGTGLGLSSVYGMVKQGGGSILVYSEVGRGTTIKIFLPRIEGQAPGEVGERPGGAADWAGTGMILLVEDEDAVRRFARRALESAGYGVMEAADGAEAIRLAEQGIPFDLLLTDVIMPGINGRQLAARLSGRSPGCAVLFMSGYTENAIVHHGVLDEDAAFLQKPFTRSDLLCKVKETLQARALPGSPG